MPFNHIGETYITKNAGVTAATVDEAYEAITNGRLFYLTPDRFTFRDAQTLYRELKVTYWEHHGDKVENYADEKRLSYRMTAALKNLKVLLFHNTTGWVALHGAPQLPKHQQWNWREQYWPKDATEVSFTDVLAINSSFQQWKNGIQYPGLKYKLHPHYNVYYPTQAGHIKLFRKWMQQYSSRKRFQSLNVADIGCGCGILAFLLGTFDAVKLVHATDINPAATESLRADQIVRKRSVKTLEVFCGDLLEPLPLPQYDLIVFNAPWLPDIAGVDHSRGSFDMAVSFPPDLYPRFFEQAKERLTPDGRIVVIGSDLSRLLGLEKESPVTRELRDNPDRFYCAAMYQGEHAPGLLKKDSVVPEDKNKGPGDSKASADTTYKANKWKAIATRQQKMQLWELEHEYPADIVNPEEQ
ncbi:hypothetical protein SARC_09240 [Sphaeroforma arctica JP610]|uniref:Methyltransferase small domain-containing protein n=1 Tax=Sphaeroforma arctica JP610 TaxID=667725 RepID=A0A0L0FNF4_9EUKA|nr:hypothetical protein SARC_09240 [Sphaeroforma arctica JP610]KNC78327.1 hypothetical protein SARC_09240 [Sphaeroforma arctica JP610]|eukprot:XP_014152229.1 hypothetical protein SARC_09240 [Sphaeroforma arctica JP610]